MAKRKKTPAECIGAILRAAMGAQGISNEKLADLVGLHRNTVRTDLEDPDKMKMERVWMYFTALGVPVDEGMQAFADSFAKSLTVR
jgi:transcriptional regulator with XRE-family HTH domain